MGTCHMCRWSLVCIRIAKIYKCDTCHKDVERITSLSSSNTAMGNVAGYHEACFKCRSCEKVFGQKGSFQVHMRRHSDAKPYKCIKCDRGFVTQAGLVIHKAGHKIRNVEAEKHDDSDKCFDHIEQNQNKNQICNQSESKHSVDQVLEVQMDDNDRNSAQHKNTTETYCDDLKSSDVFSKHSINSSQNVSKTRRRKTSSHFNQRIQIKKQKMDTGDRSVCNMKTGKSLKSIETYHSITEVNSVHCTRLITKSKKQSSYPIVGNKMTTRSSVKKKEPISTKVNRNINKYVSTKTQKIKSNDRVKKSKTKTVICSRKKESCIEHVPKVNKKLLFKCDFESRDKKLFQCDICKKICGDSSKLKDHLRLHTGEKPFVCKVCSKGFRLNACLNVHMRVHTGEMPFHCSTCSKEFKYRSTFRRHIATHQPDPDNQIKCDRCDKRFMTREGFWDHSKKSKKCDVCSEVLCTNTALNIHKYSIHTVDTFSVVDMNVRHCHFCKKTFKLNYSFLLHMQKHARKGMPVKFPCSICSEYFDSYDLLRDHRKTHSMKRDKCVKCPLPHCGRMLTSQTRLKLHLKRHNGETQYLCHRCGMRFTDCVFYLKHRKACYQKITKHDCSMCGKVLSGYTALHRHVLAHKGEKPCQCEVCGSRFNNTSHLKRHKRIHVRKGEMPPFDGDIISVESLNYSDPAQAQNYTEYTEAVDVENEEVATYLVEQQNGTTYISTMEVPVHLQTELLSATTSVDQELENEDSLFKS